MDRARSVPATTARGEVTIDSAACHPDVGWGGFRRANGPVTRSGFTRSTVRAVCAVPYDENANSSAVTSKVEGCDRYSVCVCDLTPGSRSGRPAVFNAVHRPGPFLTDRERISFLLALEDTRLIICSRSRSRRSRRVPMPVGRLRTVGCLRV